MNYTETETAKLYKIAKKEIVNFTKKAFKEKDAQKRNFFLKQLDFLQHKANDLAFSREEEIRKEGFTQYLIDGRFVYKKDIIAVQSKFDLDDEDAGRYALMLRDMHDFSLFDISGEVNPYG